VGGYKASTFSRVKPFSGDRPTPTNESTMWTLGQKWQKKAEYWQHFQMAFGQNCFKGIRWPSKKDVLMSTSKISFRIYASDQKRDRRSRGALWMRLGTLLEFQPTRSCRAEEVAPIYTEEESVCA
jgi:hypothetical protein